jgi:DNA-binding LacI/PurR family transcriptional regulator
MPWEEPRWPISPNVASAASYLPPPERRDVQWLAQARLNGVRQGCVERALEPPIVQVVPSSRTGAQEAIMHLLEQQSPPFGVCSYNDEVAFAVLAASRGEPIREALPKPFSIVVRTSA